MNEQRFRQLVHDRIKHDDPPMELDVLYKIAYHFAIHSIRPNPPTCFPFTYYSEDDLVNNIILRAYDMVTEDSVDDTSRAVVMEELVDLADPCIDVNIKAALVECGYDINYVSNSGMTGDELVAMIKERLLDSRYYGMTWFAAVQTITNHMED